MRESFPRTVSENSKDKLFRKLKIGEKIIINGLIRLKFFKRFNI